MAILDFQKPDKVIMIESDDFNGRFEFRPLEPGYGITIGNALRRILLSSLEGFAITSVKFENVQHEFSTIPGIYEDVPNIILNLKQIRFRQSVEDTDLESVVVNVSDAEEFKAGDINKYLNGFEVLNPDLVICKMEKSARIQTEFRIEKGRGYLPAEMHDISPEIGLIAFDSFFTPIKT